ncbi:MAG: hypothetical protein ABI467_15410 [Kofleriaceae bacterium]
MKRGVAVAALALALILLICGVIGLRAVLAGRGALADGDDWMRRGKPAEAIRSYEAAARWYVPFAPHVDTAYAKLRALTATPDALLAWRAIRSAARATRSLWQPHATDLADADAQIAKLEAGATPEPWFAGRLAVDPRPSIAMAALAGLGILLGLLGAAVVVFRRWSTPAGATIVLGVAVWLVGLYNA